MRKSETFAVIIFAIAVSVLTVCYIVSTLAGNDAPKTITEAPEPTRIEAPQQTQADDTMLRFKKVAPPEEETTATIEAVEVATPELTTYSTEIPLDAEIQHHVVTMCAERGIDPAIVFAQIWRESTYRADTIGDRGNSYGLMQVQPRWHRERMEKLGVTDLLDPIQNTTVGIDYLDELLDIYRGDIGKALVAYNQGHYKGTITAYAKDVLAEAERIATNGP